MENIHEFNWNTRVFVNGNIAGIHKNPKELYEKLINYKRKGIINIYTGISWDISKSTVNISTEAGRCVRPVYIVKDNTLFFNKNYILALKNKQLSWKNLVADIINNDLGNRFETVIEYIDVEENK